MFEKIMKLIFIYILKILNFIYIFLFILFYFIKIINFTIFNIQNKKKINIIKDNILSNIFPFIIN